MKENMYIPHKLAVKLSRYWDKDHPDDADENAVWGTITALTYSEVINWLESKNIYLEICPTAIPQDAFNEESSLWKVGYYICVYENIMAVRFYDYAYSTPYLSSRKEALDCAIEYVIDNILMK